MTLDFIFFDVGETLIDETRIWRGWASYLGVPYDAFFAALGAVIESDQHHERVFHRFRPGFDMAIARRERASRNDLDTFSKGDLYPDAAPTLRELRSAGFKVGVAGNAPPDGDFLDALSTDVVTSAEELGAVKPSPQFFARIAELVATSPSRIAYVGDRLDNDVIPARTAGMVGVFLERGPWGRAHASRLEAASADIRLTSLTDLPQALLAF